MRRAFPVLPFVAILLVGAGSCAEPAGALSPRRTSVSLKLVGTAVAGTPVGIRVRARPRRGSRLTRYSVMFGDQTKPRRGKKAPQLIRHIYSRAGRYRVTMTVVDGTRRRTVARLLITVRRAMPPLPPPPPQAPPPPAPLPPAPPPAATRSTVDRPDDFPARTQQVHVMYVLPSNGADRELDVTGAIEASVGVGRRWMSDRTGGRQFRFDTYGGALDVTFVRLGSSDAQLAANGFYIRDALEAELRAGGFADSFKIYAVLYDGTAHEVCANSGWPPGYPGHVAALYLRGQFSSPTIPDCDTNPFAAAGGAPGYREFLFLHELIHATGGVPTCAIHHGAHGHTVDNPNDLMYGGSAPWRPTALDPGRDDYYDHGRANCLDLKFSGYLVGNPTTALPGETLPP